jgi:hypothetical protein
MADETTEACDDRNDMRNRSRGEILAKLRVRIEVMPIDF